MKNVRLTIGIIIVFVFFQSCISKDEKYTNWDLNYQKMSGLKSVLLDYKNKYGTFPNANDVLNGNKLGAGFKDIWGNTYDYFTDGSNFVLLSKGKDLNDNSDDSTIIFINNYFHEYYCRGK